ncbi:hypothetical protein [Rhizorhapis suberifaciens]|uniref:DUF3618 domain-containing protein n=1 Tax=Rhizorhapis suberifaciens TaxID=13656 RepID=A0A840HQY9_9SPHN|nr:hypothetical protein [Rhizorhapis suberifaciens]MBB4640047.1 hypothetical protein [Rhizorhapis suberifaciens]
MKLIPRSPAYRRAETEAELARSSFLLALERARHRLHPSALKQDLERKVSEAAHGTRQAAAHSARSHPFVTGGALAIVLGLVFRRPLAALTRKAKASLSNAWQARRNSGDDQ